jgi:holliday junction DNA helicase RuvB
MSQRQILWNKILTPQERLEYLNPERPGSPYYGFIGNKRAVQKLIRLDFQALGRENHVCNDQSISFIGQAGCGKTNLARRHARANGLPLVEISPKSIKTTQDIFNAIARVLADERNNAKDGSSIALEEMGDKNYIIPPINLFIDEVHALAGPVVDGLLKATEHDDGILVTEKGLTVDCRYIHWIIATTERGLLFDAFDTRFTKVVVNFYSKDEVAQIVQHTNPDLNESICKLVAHYCSKIPREALAFAREIKMEHDMNTNQSWSAIARKVAEDNEIDAGGMNYKSLAILKALGQGPIAEKRLPIVAGVKVEELNKFFLPWLLATTEDQAAMVGVSHKGYTITEAGLEQLNLRNIPNKGEKALAA